MNIKIKIEVEKDIRTLKVNAGVRYWEDTEVNGVEDTSKGDHMPCKKGELWCPIIDIGSGKILNWEIGKRASVHYKVCDCCGWELMDIDGEIVLSAEDGYVPDTLCPQGRGYGDYIIMSILRDGQIENWNFDISDFTKGND